jgi:hypothetical protein
VNFEEEWLPAGYGGFQLRRAHPAIMADRRKPNGR